MSFFSSIISPLRGVFGTAYDAANPTRDRRVPDLIVTDARNELAAWNRLRLISTTRSLVRNYGFAREQVNAMEMYAVGDGIMPQPSSPDPEWNAAAEKFFTESFASRPETTGRFTFGKLTRLVCRALDTDGEIFFVKRRDASGLPRLQTFEAHRISGKHDPAAGVFDGIEFGDDGAPKAYYFLADDGGEVRVAAKHVIHVFVAERASDAHGVPQLQHAINALLDTKELLAIEKKSVKLTNDMTFAITSEKNEFDAASGDYVFAPEGGTDPDAFKRVIGGGKIGKLSPGEKIEALNPQRPSPTFTGFLDANLRDASLGNVPYEFVSDSSKIAGAGVRLIVGRAARVFSRRQQELIEMFLAPCWRFVIGAAITDKRLPAQEDWTRAEWACPKSVTVDAGREAAQDRADVEGGFLSLSDYYAARGLKYKDEVRRIAADLKLAAETAKEFGVPPEAVFSKLQQSQRYEARASGSIPPPRRG